MSPALLNLAIFLTSVSFVFLAFFRGRKHIVRNVLIASVLLAPFNLDGNVISVFGSGVSQKEFYSIASLYQRAGQNAVTGGFSLYQRAGQNAGTGVFSLYQRADHDTVTGVLSLYQRAGQSAKSTAFAVYQTVQPSDNSGSVKSRLFGINSTLTAVD